MSKTALKSLEKREERHLLKYGHFKSPETEILDGHPSMVVKNDDFNSIFDPPTLTKITLSGMEIVIAKNLEPPENITTKANFKAIEDGKWSIEKMQALIYFNELPPLPSDRKRKADYIQYILENREKIR